MKWPMVPLGEVLAAAKLVRAGTGDYPVLSMTMHGGLVDQSQKFKKRIASKDVSDYKVVTRGQLVVGFPIDEGVLDFQNLYDAAIVSPAYGVWDLDHAYADRRYLRHFLRSPRAMAYYKGKLRGSTARRRSLPTNVFLELAVPLPPLDEQRRIAAILDHTDGLRMTHRQVVTMTDDLERALFIETFGSPSQWPRLWPMGTIGDMAESVQYGTASKAGQSGHWPILRMGNITDSGKLDMSDLKWIELTAADVAKFTVRRGDLLFNRTNSREKVGKTCVVNTDGPLAFAGYLIRVRVTPQHRPEFVSAYMTSEYGRALRIGMAKTAVNQANINATEMRSIPIALPPTAVQAKFAESVAAISDQATRRLDVTTTLDTLFASLQHRAFRGEL